MTISNIILDFDGTLTDIYAGARGFEQEWRRLFAERTGLREDVLTMLANSTAPRVAADPTKGWSHDRQIVSPATADPYVMTATVYREILDGLRLGRIKMAHHPLPETAQKTDEFFQDLFRTAYAAKTGAAFREDTKEFLDSIVDSYETMIVTNSDAKKVSEMLGMLGGRFGRKERPLQVIGDAKKYVNNPDFDLVPATMRIDGFGRDILLRREQYYSVLTMLTGSGFYPHNTVVIGDNFELDLAMPSKMGYFTMQVETRGTQPHERRYHQRHLRSAIVPDLDGVLDVLGIRK